MYLTILSCIRCVSSGYFKSLTLGKSKKIVKLFGECKRDHIAKRGDELLTRVARVQNYTLHYTYKQFLQVPYILAKN